MPDAGGTGLIMSLTSWSMWSRRGKTNRAMLNAQDKATESDKHAEIGNVAGSDGGQGVAVLGVEGWPIRKVAFKRNKMEPTMGTQKVG